MDGWKITVLLGWLIVRGELFQLRGGVSVFFGRKNLRPLRFIVGT